MQYGQLCYRKWTVQYVWPTGLEVGDWPNVIGICSDVGKGRQASVGAGG